MALLEASPVFLDTRADLRLAEFEELEPSFEELQSIEAEDVEELVVDPLEMMATYVKSLRGERFAARDVSRFQPDLAAQERAIFMQKFIKGLLRDEETAPLLRAEGNTKGRTYWLASLLTSEAAAEGPQWFETHANIELGEFAIRSREELNHVQRLLQRLHDLREEGIKEINGQPILDIFAACNASIAAFAKRVSMQQAREQAVPVHIARIGSVPPAGDAIVDDYDYTDFANCRGVDPDLFFPERGASVKEAKEVCRGCVVRDDCLEAALTNGEKFGIWGGMSERERRRIRRQRRLAAKTTQVALAD